MIMLNVLMSMIMIEGKIMRCNILNFITFELHPGHMASATLPVIGSSFRIESKALQGNLMFF